MTRLRLWIIANWHVAALAGLIIALGILRLRAYGDLQASIGTADTRNFVLASRLPFNSVEFFTSNRPPAIGLVYKLLEPESGYSLEKASHWAVTGTSERKLQPGFDRVVGFQIGLSMLAWTVLAIAFARRLASPVGKLVGAGLILLFAFSPPLAEWDSVLMSESVSFSLFALILALTFELTPRLAKSFKALSRIDLALIAIWLLLIALWVFARDSNAYALLVVIGVLLAAAVFRWRKALRWRRFIVLGALLGALFGLHSASLYNSNRWVNPFFNNLIHNVFPYPERVEFFAERRMPVNDELLALQESRGNERRFHRFEEFMSWTREKGSATYTSFLLAHPGWAAESLVADLDSLFSQNSQTYFRSTPSRLYRILQLSGDMLHIESSGVVLLTVILTSTVSIWALRTGSRRIVALTWVFAAMLLAEALMLFVSYHGDSLGVVRHTLVAVMPLRLSLWILLTVVLDLARVTKLDRVEASAAN